MTNIRATVDPTNGNLPATEFPPDEFPELPQGQDEFGPIEEEEVTA